MSNKLSPALTRAARRAAGSPFFLASVLFEYQGTQGLDDAGLAALLGCPADDLSRLALCRRPAGEPVTFMRDVEHLAQRFGLQTSRLAGIIRHVDALQELRHAAVQNNQQILRAARDRDELPPAESGGDDE